jgi:hypothetical protein
MTEKGTPSETPRIEHLPSGLAMLCRPNGGCRPATKEELFFDSENSRLRDELAEFRTRNDTQLCTLLKVTGKLQAAEARADRADTAVQQIGIRLGTSDEWASQESMIADVTERADSLARELVETERKYLDAWRESQIERAAAVAAESSDHTCHWHDHFVAEAAKCLAAESALNKLRAAYEQKEWEWCVERDRAESLARELEKKTAALTELVRLKGLREQANAVFTEDEDEAADAQWHLLMDEYERCKPAAWVAACAALQSEEK